MPRFYFHLHNDVTSIDEEGTVSRGPLRGSIRAVPAGLETGHLAVVGRMT